MKHGHALAIGLAALALAACGGHGDNGGSTGTTVAAGSYRVEAELTDALTQGGNVATQDLNGGFLYPDPLNLQIGAGGSAGESVTFQLVNYSGSGSSLTRHVVSSGVTFSSSGPTADGIIGPGDGVFSTVHDTANQNYVVTASYQGNNYTTDYRINPYQILLRGRVVGSTGLPVFNAEVDFYGPQNLEDTTSSVVLKATTHTAYNGTFYVSIPAPSTIATTYDQAVAAAPITFTVSQAGLPSGNPTSFTYRGNTYTDGSTVSRPQLLSQTAVSNTDGLVTNLPFAPGSRYLVDTDVAVAPVASDLATLKTNGTIVLTDASGN